MIGLGSDKNWAALQQKSANRREYNNQSLIRHQALLANQPSFEENNFCEQVSQRGGGGSARFHTFFIIQKAVKKR